MSIKITFFFSSHSNIGIIQVSIWQNFWQQNIPQILISALGFFKFLSKKVFLISFKKLFLRIFEPFLMKANVSLPSFQHSANSKASFNFWWYVHVQFYDDFLMKAQSRREGHWPFDLMFQDGNQCSRWRAVPLEMERLQFQLEQMFPGSTRQRGNVGRHPDLSRPNLQSP